MKDKKLTLRETLALHREQPLCSSCHNRMDPLGLALENFNAMGMWRDQERGQPIDATGKLISGESFTNIVELKKILAENHATEFYRTLTEKLLTYALGRGLEYYDVATVDAIVERLEKSDGRPSDLLAGIIESAPFQKTRAFAPAEKLPSTEPVTPRADARINAMKTNLNNIAAERHFAFNRRHFLRGLGACIALPAFESLGALKALAAPASKLATTASGAPLRTAFVYFPNGAIPAAWWPKARATISSSAAR